MEQGLSEEVIFQLRPKGGGQSHVHSGVGAAGEMRWGQKSSVTLGRQKLPQHIKETKIRPA